MDELASYLLEKIAIPELASYFSRPTPLPILQPARSARKISGKSESRDFGGKSAREARRGNFGGILKGFAVEMLRIIGARSAPRKILRVFSGSPGESGKSADSPWCRIGGGG